MPKYRLECASRGFTRWVRANLAGIPEKQWKPTTAFDKAPKTHRLERNSPIYHQLFYLCLLGLEATAMRIGAWASR